MKNKTLRVIVILLGLLVLNIEAAHAGITHKVKVLITSELSDFQLFYLGGGALSLALLSYIIFTPAFKEKGKSSLAGTYLENYSRHTFHMRRNRIRKISHILSNSEADNQAHY